MEKHIPINIKKINVSLTTFLVITFFFKFFSFTLINRFYYKLSAYVVAFRPDPFFKEKFAYANVLEKQGHLVRDRIDTIRGYFDVTGRRYCVYFIENPGRFKWKPRNPIYFLNGKYLSKKEKEILAHNGKTVIYENMEINVLPRGIQRLEKGDLVFEGSKVPVILWDNYLEWVDPHPAADNSDFEIKADKQEKGVYYNLVFTTGGFVLRVGRARIVQSDKVVEIHPLPLQPPS